MPPLSQAVAPLLQAADPLLQVAAPLVQKHGVAEGEEAVALVDGVLVGGQDVLASAESGDEHHERGTRHVEVGDEGIDHMELVARQDVETRGLAVAGDKGAAAAVGRRCRRIGRRSSEPAPWSPPSACAAASPVVSCQPAAEAPPENPAAEEASGSQALSRLRTLVVPTAMTRPPAAWVAFTASTVAWGTV